MRYSEDKIEEVRTANDIVDVISGYVKLTRKGSSYFGLCPFHSEKSPSFSVSPGKQMYYCFGCGAGGNVITFIMEYENYTFVEAVKYLADRAGIELPQIEYTGEEKAKADRRAAILEVNKVAANYFYAQLRGQNGEKARAYLEGRKLTVDTIRHFGLGYSNKYSDDLYKYLKTRNYSDELLKDSGLVGFNEKYGVMDKFWNRVMYPIMDVNNKVIGFGGRVMGDGEPKYLNSQETPVFDKSRNLYGLNFARTSRENYIMVCEGYMDVISLHQAGFTNAVASLGTALTQGHANLLKRYTKEVVLVYDSDAAGTKATLRAIPIFREAGIRTKVLRMSPYKDPDEFIKNMGAEEFKKRIDSANNSFLFEIEVLQRDYDMSDPEEKSNFFKEVASRLLIFSEELERENYITAIADIHHIKAEQLRSLVTSVSLKMSGMKPVEKPKSGINRKKETTDGAVKAQQYLLTSLIENPGLYDSIKDIIKPEDFYDELFNEVATKLYEQMERNEINPSRIISSFTEGEDQRRVAGLFNARIDNVLTKEDKQKALADTIYRVKEKSIEHRTKNLEPTDLAGLQEVVRAKQELQKLAGLHINLKGEK